MTPTVGCAPPGGAGVADARLDLRDFVCVCAAPLEGEALADRGVEITTLGVGKTRAALSMLTLLQRQPEVRGVLLFGVAGAARSSRLAPGSICVVGSESFGDEGVLAPDGFQDIAALGLGEVGPFELPPDLAAAAAGRLGVEVVHGTTVSTCSGTDPVAAAVTARTGAAVETMEGAAVALACRERGVPLLQIRAISNWLGDRDRAGWDLPGAVQSVQRAVVTLLTN